MRSNIERLIAAVDTLGALAVPAAAADFLDALYGFTRLWRDKILRRGEYDLLCATEDDGGVVAGLTYLRGQGTHQAITVSKLDGRVAEHFYSHFECWVWSADAPVTDTELCQSYTRHVANREVRVTLEAVSRFCWVVLPQARAEPQTPHCREEMAGQRPDPSQATAAHDQRLWSPSTRL